VYSMGLDCKGMYSMDGNKKEPGVVRLGPWEADRRLGGLVWGVRDKAILSDPSANFEPMAERNVQTTNPPPKLNP